MWSPTPTVPSSGAPGPFSQPGRKLGFFQRMRIGWQLTKVSLGILRKEKGLILLPFLSLLLTGAAWLVFVSSIYFFSATPSNPFGYWLFYVGLAIVYFVTFFVSIYFNAAVMGAAMIRLNGGDPTISDGLKVANANLKRIAGWALVSATVGLVLRALAERFGVIGRIVAGFAGLAWGVADPCSDKRGVRPRAGTSRSVRSSSCSRCRTSCSWSWVVSSEASRVSSSDSRSPSSTGYSSGSSEPPRRASS